jgi:hypothetical protein
MNKNFTSGELKIIALCLQLAINESEKYGVFSPEDVSDLKKLIEKVQEK